MGSSTQFAWRVLGLGDYPPSTAKRSSSPADAPCWLCGAHVGPAPWRRDDAIPTTFASHNLARAPTSDAVCQACAALAVGATWQRYVAERQPAGVKTWGTASWRCYGHLFAGPDRHECPVPERWRAILTEPPEPPFLCAISLSGQKNLIFRSPLARSRDLFGVQFEEETVTISRPRLIVCLDAVEDAARLGIPKEQARSGRYHPETLRRVGIAASREIEDRLRPLRLCEPDMLAVAAWCGRGPKHFQDEAPAAAPAASASPPPSPPPTAPAPNKPRGAQMELAL